MNLLFEYPYTFKTLGELPYGTLFRFRAAGKRPSGSSSDAVFMKTRNVWTPDEASFTDLENGNVYQCGTSYLDASVAIVPKLSIEPLERKTT